MQGESVEEPHQGRAHSGGLFGSVTSIAISTRISGS
jgi:hypothetical protein